MNSILNGLEPRSFFYWFDEISRIPRGSKTEQQVCAFLMRFAEEHGYEAEQDALGNILMRVPATSGYETEPVLLVQAHVDMVWTVAPGVTHDFEKEPIGYRIENGNLYGNGTNLGSDNAIGIAFMLAVADGDEFAHPELELLFTVQEEIGLIGMKNFDMAKLRARRMINTDCGRAHEMCVSSVGCKIYSVEESMPVSDGNGFSFIKVTVAGGLGGHGGLDAHRNRMDAASLMGELFAPLGASFGMRLASLGMEGGYIHCGGTAVVAVKPEQREAATEALKAAAAESLARYKESDPGVTVAVEAADGNGLELVSEGDSLRIFRLLGLIPSGALRHDAEDLRYIITSAGLTKTALDHGTFTATFSTRSAIDNERDLWSFRFTTVCELLGFSPKLDRFYGGWPERKGSVLQKKVREAHEKLFGTPIGIEHIHGGIEASFVIMAHPDMDIIGISPSALGAHTLDEHIILKETPEFWKLMKAVLAAKDA